MSLWDFKEPIERSSPDESKGKFNILLITEFSLELDFLSCLLKSSAIMSCILNLQLPMN